MARSENEDFEVELTDAQLIKVLHEPLAPYLANTYNTLTHLVQGVVLAAILYVISIYWGHITPLIICNLIICILIVITVWHGYLMSSQYYVIRATPLNTIIPIILGILQVVLALTVAEPIYIFTLLVLSCFILFMIQVLDNIKKDSKPIALKIYKEHFKELGSQFAQDMYDEMRRYQKAGLQNIIYFNIFIGLLTLFNYFFPLNLEIKGYITFILLFLMFITGVFIFTDMNRFLNNSEKLKKYGYEW